ncbi:C-C motif chemokine 7-like [Mobula birostris]|uniref:C-C motif chemokine 7-like n=1 Tax=Mobula birostris TaxID=1983395 RepID=UPI003B283EF4
MKTVPAALCLLSAVAAFWSISQASDSGNSLTDCCLRTSPKIIPVNFVKSYEVQTPGNGCNIHAVMFRTKRNKVLCSPPKKEWVLNLIETIDNKKKSKKLKKLKKQKKSRAKKN